MNREDYEEGRLTRGEMEEFEDPPVASDLEVEYGTKGPFEYCANCDEEFHHSAIVNRECPLCGGRLE